MRHWVHVDQQVALGALSSAQVVAASQIFPLTKTNIRILFASVEFDVVDVSKVGLAQRTCPFIAIGFTDSSSALIDTLYLETLPNFLVYFATFNPEDVAGAPFKFNMTPAITDAFFLTGEGGYPTGAVGFQLMGGASFTNTNAGLASDAIVRLRAIVEELGAHGK